MASEPELSNSNSEEDDSDPPQVLETSPITPNEDSDMTIRAVNGSDEDDDGEYGSEVDMVKGVYYDDGSGNVLQLE